MWFEYRYKEFRKINYDKDFYFVMKGIGIGVDDVGKWCFELKKFDGFYWCLENSGKYIWF